MLEIPKFQFVVREDLLGSSISFLPTRATPKATGWDVRAAFPDHKSTELRAGSYLKIPLGFRVFAPEGWWFELRPRSSTFAKKQLHSLYGVIDEDYENECLFACQYLPDIRSIVSDLTIQFGECIGQIIPVKRQEMEIEEITPTQFAEKCASRNSQRIGGFGSTGK